MVLSTNRSNVLKRLDRAVKSRSVLQAQLRHGGEFGQSVQFVPLRRDGNVIHVSGLPAINFLHLNSDLVLGSIRRV